MPPQRRYTLFLTPPKWNPIILSLNYPGLRGPMIRHEAGAVVVVQVLARSHEKAIKKLSRLHDKPKHKWIATCFWATSEGASGLALVLDRERRKDGDWLALDALERLREAQHGA